MEFSRSTVVHTELPAYQGEREVISAISSFKEGNLQVWCGLNFIPGCNDADLFILDENIGAFVVEIKAININAINEITYTEWDISGRGRKISPVFQAFRAMGHLSEYLKSRMKRKPFMVATACLPKITRDEWISCFDGSGFNAEYADSLIFADDFFGGYETLSKRLRMIYRSPPVGTPLSHYFEGGKREFWMSDDAVVESLKSALNPSAKPKLTPTDIIRLKAIESGLSSKIIKDYPPEVTNFGLFRGAAGTGKTFRLVQILVNYAYSGKSTLLCCFNKTLAADVRRLLCFSEKIQKVDKYPDVFDFFHLASDDQKLLALNFESNETPNAWFDRVVSELQLDSSRLLKYDLIVVDESQELRESEKMLLRLHLKPGGSLFFSLGDGQEVYSDRTPFSEGDAKSFFSELGANPVPNARTLRRNFRNSRKVFLGAVLFHRCYGFKNRSVSNELEKLVRGGDSQLELKFDRDSLGALNLELIGEDGLPDRSDSFFPMAQEELMVDSYFRLIKSVFDNLSSDDFPIDLLVLVPGPSGLITEWTKLALNKFKEETGIGFNDLCDENNRRITCDVGKVRLCTFHSSRGLEAANVIVFGFDRLEEMAKKFKFSANNLGYIVLSRAMVSTTVVFPPISTEIRLLMEEISRELFGNVDFSSESTLALE